MKHSNNNILRTDCEDWRVTNASLAVSAGPVALGVAAELERPRNRGRDVQTTAAASTRTISMTASWLSQCPLASASGGCLNKPEIVAPGGAAALQELKELRAGSRLSGLSGRSGRKSERASAKVPKNRSKVRKHRSAQAATINQQNIETQIQAHLPEPDNQMNFERNPMDVTPTSCQDDGHEAAIEPWSIRHEDDEEPVYPCDHNRPCAQEQWLPLTGAEIRTALTITVRGQTMELLDFVREHFDSVDEFINCVNLCAELAEGEIQGANVEDGDLAQ